MSQIDHSGPLFTNAHKSIPDNRYTMNEIKSALMCIDETKATGPDGFGDQFYKDAWGNMRGDVINPLLDFFNIGELLKEVKSTTITLIPKSIYPTNAAVMFCINESQKWLVTNWVEFYR